MHRGSQGIGGDDFIPVDDDGDALGDEQGGQAGAEGGRRKSAPAALRGEEGQQPVAAARRTAMQSSDTPPWWHRQAPRTMSRLRSPLLRLHQGERGVCIALSHHRRHSTPPPRRPLARRDCGLLSLHGADHG